MTVCIHIYICTHTHTHTHTHTLQRCIIGPIQRGWHTLRLRLTNFRVNQSGKSKLSFLVINLQKYWSNTFKVSGWIYRRKLYFNIHTVEKLYSTIRRSILFQLHAFIFLQLLCALSYFTAETHLLHNNQSADTSHSPQQ